jgi:hypothetical protein
MENVAKRSRNTLLVMQVVMAALMGAMAFALIIGGTVIYQNKASIERQVNINTEQRLHIAAAVAAQQNEQHRVATALCDNQYTIANVPVPANGSKILVQFVESSRKAFVLLGCNGHLQAPPDNLIKAARAQGVPIRY